MNLGVLRSNRAPYIGTMHLASGSTTNVALNGAYSHGASGPAVGVRFSAVEAVAITEFYVFLGAFSGTLGNISMECILYNENPDYPARPGTTVRATSSATTMPDAAVKWIKFAFGTPYTPANGEILWCVVRNTASNPTVDYPSLRNSVDGEGGDVPGGVGIVAPYTTANGFTSNGTLQGKLPFVIVGDNGPILANVFTSRGTCFASNMRERGIRFTPQVDCVCFGVVVDTAFPAYDTFRILADATAPGGTALLSRVWNATNRTANAVGNLIFASPITLSRGITYKAVSTFSGWDTDLPRSQGRIDDYSSYSSLFDAIRAKDTHHYPSMVVDNGSGGWTEFKDYSGGIVLGVDDFPRMRSPAVGDFQGGLR